jgi:hypothetical protein
MISAALVTTLAPLRRRPPGPPVALPGTAGLLAGRVIVLARSLPVTTRTRAHLTLWIREARRVGHLPGTWRDFAVTVAALADALVGLSQNSPMPKLDSSRS